MMSTSTKYKLIVAITVGLLFPLSSFAQTNEQICTSTGYTIATINGMFTNKEGAIENSDELRRKMLPILHGIYKNEPLTVEFLLNPSHLAGIGDIFAVAYQKYFDTETVKDYDLVNMLNDASAKVKTQKLLLIAHSQGNFYANSFYDTVAGKVGGVPTGGIGVYGVASPASRVAGNGKYMTSSTDTVIEKLRWKGILSIMPANEDIKLPQGDTSNGHGFSDTYLKYRGSKIVSDVQLSLDKLSSDPERREDIRCIDPPELTITHKIVGVVLYVADPVANISKIAVVGTYSAGVFVVKTTVQSALAVGSAISLFTQALASNVGGLIGTNQSASVALTTQKVETTPIAIAVINNPAIVPSVAPKIIQASIIPDGSKPTLTSINTTPAPIIVKVLADTSQSKNATRLVFVGNFVGGGGGPATPASVQTESVGAALAAPTLVPQCTSALATSTNGCLLATTTVRFNWTAVAGASHYSINKNGILATTTELSFETTARDFSDYTFEIASVDNMGTASATSSKTISVATIPIAINEIAWMGTVASSNAEWIELKNNTAYTINLSQWALEAKDKKPYIILSGKMAPQEYRILERKSDTVIMDIVAGQVYGNNGPDWALNNQGDQLTLLYASSTMDQTPSGLWVAGDNTTKKTMERRSLKTSGVYLVNWGTNNGTNKNGTDADGNLINGTPGAENSVYLAGLLDVTPPVVTILGSNPATVTIGSTYTDAGASALDDIDGVRPVTASSTVNLAVVGAYAVTYVSSDITGNTSTSTRTVSISPYIGKQINFDASNKIAFPGPFIVCNMDERIVYGSHSDGLGASGISSTHWASSNSEPSPNMQINKNFRFIMGPYASIQSDCSNGTQANDYSNSFYYSTTSGASVVYDPLSASAITSFTFEGLAPSVATLLEKPARTVLVTVPQGTTLSALIPSISVSSGATVSPQTNIAQDFTNPVTYTVTASDGSTQTYSVTASFKGSLVTFDPSTNTINYQGPFIICNMDTRGIYVDAPTFPQTWLSSSNWNTTNQATPNTGMNPQVNYRFILNSAANAEFDCSNDTYLNNHSNSFYYANTAGDSVVYGTYTP